MIATKSRPLGIQDFKEKKKRKKELSYQNLFNCMNCVC